VQIGSAVIERHAYHEAEAPNCQAKTVDGRQCAKAGTNVIDGRSVCGLHLNQILAHAEQEKVELARYETYQRLAFGNVVRGWVEPRLNERLRELAQIAGDEGDLHFRRLRAERDAIGDERARRATEGA
jgi:hypothetical protein